MDFDFLFCVPSPKAEDDQSLASFRSPPRLSGAERDAEIESISTRLRDAEEALVSKDTDLEMAQARKEALEVSTV